VLPKSISEFSIDGKTYLGSSKSNMIPFNWSATRTLIEKFEASEAKKDNIKQRFTWLEDAFSHLSYDKLHGENLESELTAKSMEDGFEIRYSSL
jgi:hypothetical protein